jgi:hypothetical protein
MNSIFAKLVLASFLVTGISVPSSASDSTAALTRNSALSRLAATLKTTSTPQEVQSVLGEPTDKHPGGWNHPDWDVWSYVDYTDEERHVSFSVIFDPKAGCSVSAEQILRTDILKYQKRVDTGTVRSVYRDDPAKGGDGFLCDVQFDGGPLLGVAVRNRTRVKGEPEPGARIRIEHYSPAFQCIFLGRNSLFLESMDFTRANPH